MLTDSACVSNTYAKKNRSSFPSPDFELDWKLVLTFIHICQYLQCRSYAVKTVISNTITDEYSKSSEEVITGMLR